MSFKLRIPALGLTTFLTLIILLGSLPANVFHKAALAQQATELSQGIPDNYDNTILTDKEARVTVVPTSAASPYIRLTNDSVRDFNPQIDNGVVIWQRETGTANRYGLRCYGPFGWRNLTDDWWSPTALQIDNGWGFWQVRDYTTDNDYEKWLYDVASDDFKFISSDAVYDNMMPDSYYHFFEAGLALWTSNQGLMFYNGRETLNLVASGNYRNFALRQGCVVWEQGTGGTSGRDYQIMLYDGTTTLNLSSFDVAKGFTGHWLADYYGYVPYCLDGWRVTWMAWDGNDWEILLYDGASVRRLTDNTVDDCDPQVWGYEVVWWDTTGKLWFYDGTTKSVITDGFNPATEHFEFDYGRAVWHCPGVGPIKVFETSTKTSRVLQESLEGTGMTIWGVWFDDKGVFWHLTTGDMSRQVLKLYDGSSVQVIADTMTSAGQFTRLYQGGYAAWTEKRTNTAPCIDAYGQPTVATFDDSDVFFRFPSGEIRQLTENDHRNSAWVKDLDNGLVVWIGDDVPPGASANSYYSTSYPDIFLGGRALVDLSIHTVDIAIAEKVLESGMTATITATVHNEGLYPVSDVQVSCLVDSAPLGEPKTISWISGDDTAQVTFPWTVSWTIQDRVKNETKIEIVADPDDQIYEISETNNRDTRIIPKLAKGQKKANADGRGFVVDSTVAVPYVVPMAIWFDDDAATAPWGQPTRHYNPIATSRDVLNDIESDFNGTQYPNGIDEIHLLDILSPQIKNILETYWERSPGIVIAGTSIGSHTSEFAAAPIASYLNWPLIGSSILPNHPIEIAALINELGITYILIVAENSTEALSVVDNLKNLVLPAGKTLFIQTFTVEPVASCGAAKAFKETLEAFGDKSGSLVVTNSRDLGSYAAMPLAAFYKSMVLDVRDVVTEAVSYAANSYTGLQSINTKISAIVGMGGVRY